MAENNQRKSTYTNAEISSYERHFTCMSFVMVEGRAMISFAPIFDEFVGKEPKRGDNVYDYDSKVNFAIDAQGALAIRQAVQNYMASDDDTKMMSVTFGGGKNSRTLAIFKPGTLKLSGKTYDNHVLRVTITKDDEEEKLYHILQRNSITYKTTSNEEIEEEFETDLQLLVEFCNQTIANGFNTAYHGAKRAGGSSSGGSSNKGQRSRRNVEEEDGDDDGDSGSSGGGKKPAGKPAKRADLNDEFDE